jgi:flagellar hook-associated protein 1 FlgK
MNSLAGDLDGLGGVLSASVLANGRLSITAAGGRTFAFSSDTSNVLAAIGINTFFTGSSANEIGINPLLNTNKEFIAAGRVNATTGAITAGENSNALAMANLQDEDSIRIARWTYDRGSPATSVNETGTLESYLHSFIGSIGVDSQSIRRSREFNDVIVQKLSETRDNISAVSLDVEMTNLIKYQHAYAAAAKLITTAEEMLDVLINTV